jgi:Holliday junction resolvase
MREQAIQSKLIKKLESQGYYVIKLIKTNKNGIPDVIAIPPHCEVEFYEVKAPGKKPSPLQVFRLNELINHGCKAEVFDGSNS